MKGYITVPFENTIDGVKAENGFVITRDVEPIQTYETRTIEPFKVFETIEGALAYNTEQESGENLVAHIYKVSFGETSGYAYKTNDDLYYSVNIITLNNEIDYELLLKSNPAEALYQVLYVLNVDNAKARHLFYNLAFKSESIYWGDTYDFNFDIAMTNIAKLNKSKYNNILVYSNIPSVQEYLVSLKNEKYLDVLVYGSIEAQEAIAKLNIDKYLDILVDSDDIGVQIAVAVAGSGKEKYLDKLIGSKYDSVLEAIAGTGIEKYCDDLVRRIPVSSSILEAIARTGNEKYLDILINSGDYNVREVVAEVGGEKYLNKLVDDPYNCVRQAVAKRGIKKYNYILVADNNDMVRGEVAKFNCPELLDELVNDNSEYVRREVLNTAVKYNLDNYIELLAYDNSLTIRREIARLDNTKCNEVLLHQDDSYTYDCMARTSTNEAILKAILASKFDDARDVARKRLMKMTSLKMESEKQAIELVNILLEGTTYWWLILLN